MSQSRACLFNNDQFFEQFVKKCFEKFNYKNIQVLNKTTGNHNPRGFMSEVAPFTVKGELNNTDVNVDIIIKILDSDVDLRKLISLEVYGLREVSFYTNVLPVFKTIQGDNVFKAPKFYGANSDKFKEIVILEDLKVKGYENCRLDNNLDYEHVVLNLEEMAKLHAISFLWKDKDLDSFNSLTNDFNDIMLTNNPMEDFNDYIIVTALKDVTDPIFKKFIEIVQERRINEKATIDDTAHSVLCHGDVWGNNCMYIYKDNKPTSVILIDWQTVRRGSPVFDLLYFIFTTVDENLRDEKFQHLIHLYYNKLKQTISELQVVDKELYPETEFRKELKLHSRQVVCSMLYLLPLFFSKRKFQDRDIPPTPKYISKMLQLAKDVLNHNLYELW